MTRKTPRPHKVKEHVRDTSNISSYVRGSGMRRRAKKKKVKQTPKGGWMLKNIPERILALRGTPEIPYFIIDENMPHECESVLDEMGYPAVHVTQIFKKGTPDKLITRYAEKTNAHIITRDIMSFPEPKHGGDRIVVVDVPGQGSVTEMVNRLTSLGVIK